MTERIQSQSPISRVMKVADGEFAAVSEGRIRIRIGAIIFLAALFLAVVRLAEVALFSPGDSRYFNTQFATPQRADIVDRNGEVLATTLATYALYARPKYVWDADATASELVNIFDDLDRIDLLEKLNRERDQVLIKRGLTPKEHQQVFSSGLPGMLFQAEPQRVYPRGHLGAHLVGFTDVDMVGLAGAERAFNDRLSTPNAPAVSLSLDLRLQNVLHEELQRSLDYFQAKSNAGVILNIKNGEILAMASLPNFDPNSPSTISPQNLYNHASMSTYELGSVFKPITMAMALENDITDLRETFPAHLPLKVRDKFIRDDHPSDVPLAMPDILAQSSNRGTALIAQKAGGEIQQSFLASLGLMDRVDIELNESAKPQLHTEWQDITTVTVSYGHGIAVTPLALSVAVGALLNGGEYIAPTILVRDTANPMEKKRVVSAATSQTVKDLMRYVATNGTGRNARVRGYGVMGKTGTADKPDAEGYDERRLVSSFVAAFPYEDPTYLVFITLDEPQATAETYGYATAGWTAAPAAGKVIERIAPMLGVPQRLDPVAYSPFSNTGALR